MRPTSITRATIGSAVVVATLVLGACADETESETGSDADVPATVAPTSTTTIPSSTTPSTSGPSTTDGSGDAMPDDTAPETIVTQPPRTTPPPTTSEVPIGADEPSFAGEIDPGLAPFVELATDDLAGRLEVDPSDITTVSAVLVTWPDASLGCPAPDMQYAQLLQDGSIIELEHDGVYYRYHSGGDRTPFPCDAPRATPPV